MAIWSQLSQLGRYASVLLGRSAYARPPSVGADNQLDSPSVIRAREALGGQLAPPGRTPTRLYLADIESATNAADLGQIGPAAQLMIAAKQDGVFAGVLSTRTDGLVRLPRRFRGDAEICAELQPGQTADRTGNSDPRSIFDEMCPPKELSLLSADGTTLGIGVAELVEVAGRSFPVLVRRDPQFLFYLWSDNTWYYQSVAGLLPIIPGDGHWVLHCPGGRVSPWQNGIWRAIARAYIRKETASLLKDNWEQKLANAARVAEAPQAATEEQQQGWFQRVAAWGINTVFSTKPGYTVKLVESNGIGWQSYSKTIEDQDREFQVAVAGQTVTTEGKSGFVSAELFSAIRSDLIQSSGDDLAYTVNTQILPAYVYFQHGEQALLERSVVMEWDTTPPKDLNSAASSLVTAANAITTLTAALSAHNVKIDVAEVCARFGVPVAGILEPVDESEPTVVGGAGQEAQDTALNGAQVSSLLEIVQACAVGAIPRDTAIGILKRAFLVTDQEAADLLGSVGAGFTPAAPASEPAPTQPMQEAA